MPEYDKPIKEINAIEYLREFINVSLILTNTEQQILNYLYDKHRNLPAKMPETKAIKKQKSERAMLAANGLKRCKMCGEILPINFFYNNFGICKKCFSVYRKREEK
jgi:formylmethanofuran dehydrogenase subunit E